MKFNVKYLPGNNKLKFLLFDIFDDIKTKIDFYEYLESIKFSDKKDDDLYHKFSEIFGDNKKIKILNDYVEKTGDKNIKQFINIIKNKIKTENDKWKDLAKRYSEIEFSDSIDDIWFAVYYGDNDFGSSAEKAMKELAKKVIIALQQNIQLAIFEDEMALRYPDIHKSYEDYFKTGNKMDKDNISVNMDYVNHPERIFNKTLNKVFYSQNLWWNNKEVLKKEFKKYFLKDQLLWKLDNDYIPEESNLDEDYKRYNNYFNFDDSNVALGKEDVLRLLNEYCLEKEKGQVTLENFKDFWWNGELVVCHIHGKNIDYYPNYESYSNGEEIFVVDNNIDE